MLTVSEEGKQRSRKVASSRKDIHPSDSGLGQGEWQLLDPWGKQGKGLTGDTLSESQVTSTLHAHNASAPHWAFPQGCSLDPHSTRVARTSTSTFPMRFRLGARWHS